MANTLEKRVMFSYHRDSKEIVELVYDAFKNNGIPVWFDNRDTHSNMEDKITDVVEKAHTVCCFLTEKYEQSPLCKLELQYAASLRKRIVPCILANKSHWMPTKGKWLDHIVRSIPLFDLSGSSEHIIAQKTEQLISKVNFESLHTLDKLPDLKNKMLAFFKQKYLRKHQIKAGYSEGMHLSIEKCNFNLTLVTSNQEERQGKLNRQNPNLSNFANNDRKIDGREIINVQEIFAKCKYKTKRIVFLGHPGIGKSTFCNYVTYQWAAGDLWPEFHLVILLSLHNLTKTRYSRQELCTPVCLIENEYFPRKRLSYEQKSILQNMNENLNILWILDDYDRYIHYVPEQVRPALKEILDKEHFILTSRHPAINLSYEMKIELIGFIDTDIENYVNQRFFQCRDETPKILNFMKSNSRVWAIAHNPLYLELLCTIWVDTDWTSTSCITVTTVYEHFAKFLRKKYFDKRKTNYDANGDQNLREHCDKEFDCLENLAFLTIQSSDLNIDHSQLNLASNSKLFNLGTYKLCDDSDANTDLDQNESYNSLHLCLQEYFAARYIARQLSTDQQSAIKLLSSHKYDQRFTTLFVFITGILASRFDSKLLELFMNTIESEPRDLVGLRHIQLIIQLFDELDCCTNYQNREKYLRDVCNWYQFAMKQKNTEIQANIAYVIANSVYLSKFISLQETHISKKEEHMSSKMPCIHDTFDVGIIDAFQDLTWYQRLAASDKFILMGERAATKGTLLALIELYGSSDRHVRDVARYTIVKISHKAAVEDLVDTLLGALQHPEWIVRKTVCSTIRAIGERVNTNDTINALIKTLRDVDERVQNVACQALVKIAGKAANDERVILLNQLLKDQQLNVRKIACIVLKAMGKKAATMTTINGLIQTIRNEHGVVRAAARDALGKIGQYPIIQYQLIDILIKWIEDPEHNIREAACQIFTKIGRSIATMDVIHVLTETLSDTEWNVRKAACESLKAFGDKAAISQTVYALIDRLTDTEEEIRSIVADVLINMPQEIATDHIINQIIRIVERRNCEITRRASQTLREMLVKASRKGNLQIVLDTLRCNNDEVRYAVCEALKCTANIVATREVIQILIELLRDQHIHYRDIIYETLATMCDVATPTRIQPTYYQARRNPEYSLIIAALYELLNCNSFRDMHVREIVINQALRYDDFSLRYQACKVIGYRDGHATSSRTVYSLLEILKNADDRLKSAACEALKSIKCDYITPDVIHTVLEVMQDPDPSVKEAACMMIGKMGKHAGTEKVIDALSLTLRHPERRVKESACKALISSNRHVPAGGSMNVLIQALQDSDSDLRRIICRTFVEMKDKLFSREFIETLVKCIQDPDCEVRKYACKALMQISEQEVTKDVVEALIRALKDPEAFVRSTACEAFEKFGDKVATHDIIYALKHTLVDADNDVRKNGCKAIAAMGEMAFTNDIFDGLNRMLKHSDRHLRKAALKTLTQMADRAVMSEPISILVQALQDLETDAKQDICEAFGKLGEKAATHDVVYALTEAVRQSDFVVSEAACKALGALGEKVATNESIDALVDLLRLDGLKSKETVLRTLQKMGEKGATDKSIDAIIEVMQHREVDLMIEAWNVLRTMGDKAVTDTTITLLTQSLRASRQYVQRRAQETLLELAKRKVFNRFVDAFIRNMKDSEEFVRVTACKILTMMDTIATQNIINEAIEASKDPKKDVKTSAYQLLGAIAEKEAEIRIINILIDALNDPEWFVTSIVREIFERLSTGKTKNMTLNTVIQALNSSEENTRCAACKALETMCKNIDIRDVTDALVEKLRDPHLSVRRAAWETLAKMNSWWVRDDTLELIFQALRDSDTDFKLTACEIIVNIGYNATKKAKKDTRTGTIPEHEYNLQNAACKVLSNIKNECNLKEIIDSIIDLADKFCWKHTVNEAFLTIWQRIAAPDNVEILMRVLQGPTNELGCSACEALKRFGNMPVPEKVIDILIEMQRSHKSEIRKAAVEAISDWGASVTKDTLKALIDKLSDQKSHVKHGARNILRNIYAKTEDPGLIHEIIQGLQYPDDEVRNLVCDIISWSFNRAASNDTIDLMIEIFRDSDEIIRKNVREAFLRIRVSLKAEDTMNSLLQLLRDPDEDVRALAYEKLADMNERTVTKETVNVLIEIMQYAGWPIRYRVGEIFDRWMFLEFDSDQVNLMLNSPEQVNDTILTMLLMSDSILLDSFKNRIVELKNYIFFSSSFRYEKIPANRLIQIWLADSCNEWISLIVHSALVQNTAVTRAEEKFILYNLESEAISQSIDGDKFLYFSQMVYRYLMDMGLSTTDVHRNVTAVQHSSE